MSLRLPIALAALSLAGAANAQPLDLRLPRADAIPIAPLGTVGHEAPRPAPDLANPLDPLAPTTRLATPLAGAVFAKTAIDHRFGRRDDFTGSLGFLCGLQPGHDDSGGAAAYGVDPHGRFVGAKFSLAFR